MLKTVKFGGSSLADAQHFSAVRHIVLADDARRIVVVSAPGKRAKDDTKLTDLLYLCHAHIKYGVNCSAVLDMIEARYQEIADELSIPFDVAAAFGEIRARIKASPDEDYLVSRGEALCAQLMAAYLGFDFVDAFDVIKFRMDGNVDLPATYAAIAAAFEASCGRIVIPGFYGAMPGNRLRLMARGGSDITGALAAAALNCDLYENWTDVPGILMADPSIVKDPQPIPRITYSELRELTYMGAKVLHEESVFPVRDLGIPLNILNTNDPTSPGTMISDSDLGDDAAMEPYFITGVAGRRGYSIMDIHKSHVSAKVGTVRSVLGAFEKYDLHVEQILSGIDCFSLVVSTEDMRPYLFNIMEEIESICGPDCVKITEHISLIACVGRRMVFRPGISGRLFAALGENGVNIRIISQGPQELSIIVGVDEHDYEKTIRVLYESFARKDLPL